MKYYLVVGEASGDLHASRLMRSIQKYDTDAEFRYFGGDNMSAVGGTLVKHYKDLMVYMGFLPILLHLRTILRNIKFCQEDILKWQPDVVILVDYPGFNLKIAKFVHKLGRGSVGAWERESENSFAAKNSVDDTNLAPSSPRPLVLSPSRPSTKVFYYISPQLWAWLEWRVRYIKHDVDELFSILPFEKDFYEKKHHYPIHYVGNPTVEEVETFLKEQGARSKEQDQYSTLDPRLSTLDPRPSTLDPRPSTKIIALLAGSREKEIEDNLPAMIEAAKRFEDYELVVAGAPAVEDSFYQRFITGTRVRLVKNQTYELLSKATVALVTSGTATLETALFNVPQVVCYKTSSPRLIRFCFNHFITVKYISLVNLIAGREVVPELFADKFKVYDIANQLSLIMPGQPAREVMLRGYAEVRQRLGNDIAPDNAARIMVEKLTTP